MHAFSAAAWRGAATAVMEQQRGRHERIIRAGMAALAAVALLGGGAARADKPLTLGVSVGLGNVAMEIAVREARAQGLDVKLVEFSDYISQNEGVNDGSLDANYYQHLPYLESMIAAKGYKLVPVALGYTSRMAIYSKHRALAELPDGAAIAYPNDPVNTGHALLILQEAGLITLKPDVGTKATLRDVTANPRKLRFRELEGSIVARALDDVDAAVIYPGFVAVAGVKPESALYAEKDSSRYAIRWVTRPENAQDPRLLKFIAIYQGSEEVRATLRRLYHDLIAFPWLEQAG